jgi:hypothetical protein
LPDIFAIPFFTFFGFPRYMLHDAKESVLIILCSLGGEESFGLPMIMGNFLYFFSFQRLFIYFFLQGYGSGNQIL